MRSEVQKRGSVRQSRIYCGSFDMRGWEGALGGRWSCEPFWQTVKYISRHTFDCFLHTVDVSEGKGKHGQGHDQPGLQRLQVIRHHSEYAQATDALTQRPDLHYKAKSSGKSSEVNSKSRSENYSENFEIALTVTLAADQKRRHLFVES